MSTEEQKEKWRKRMREYNKTHAKEISIARKRRYDKDINKSRARARKSYQRNKAAIKARAHTAKSRFWDAKNLANMRKIIFDLTFNEYQNIILNPCYYCNSSLEFEEGASLDRIDNTLGYISSNVLPCCNICNRGRNIIYTVDEWKVMMTACLEYRKIVYGSN